jgi:hypothetical protein
MTMSGDIRHRSGLIDELLEHGYDEDRLESMSTEELEELLEEHSIDDTDDPFSELIYDEDQDEEF